MISKCDWCGQRKKLCRFTSEEPKMYDGEETRRHTVYICYECVPQIQHQKRGRSIGFGSFPNYFE